MIRFEDLVEKVRNINPDADIDLLRRAYVFSAFEHKGQVRHSGEPYLVHPLEVASILADMRLDPVAIGGTSEVMQASETLDLAVVLGEPELSRLCAEIAGRVVADPELVAVELRSETYDAIAWFDGDHQPSSSITHIRCEVPR